MTTELKQKTEKTFQFNGDHLTMCAYISIGKSTRWIAAKLKRSDRTIENIILAMRKETKTKNKTHLIAFLIREKYI